MTTHATENRRRTECSAPDCFRPAAAGKRKRTYGPLESKKTALRKRNGHPVRKNARGHWRKRFHLHSGASCGPYVRWNFGWAVFRIATDHMSVRFIRPGSGGLKPGLRPVYRTAGRSVRQLVAMGVDGGLGAVLHAQFGK